MDNKTYWIWDVDNKRCVNARAIEYFDIEKLNGEHVVYATLNNLGTIIIYKSASMGAVKEKVRSLINTLGG